MENKLRFLPLAILLLLAALMILALRHEAGEQNGRLVGEKLEAFSVPLISSPGAFSPSLWQGRVAVLSVFASWCVPCAMEHPLLMRLAEKHIAVYGLAWHDKADKAADWLARHGNPYRAVGLDVEGRTTLTLALTGVPETFVIDKQGVIRYHLAGAMTEDTVTRLLLPLLERLEHEN